MTTRIRQTIAAVLLGLSAAGAVAVPAAMASAAPVAAVASHQAQPNFLYHG